MRPDGRYTPAEVAGLPVLWSGDVVVVGGGSAGCAATIAAARSGASTLLIERAGFLGGTGAAVLDSFYGFFAPGADEHRVVGGIGWEACQALIDEGQAFIRPSSYGAGSAVTYEPEALKRCWDNLVTASGAALLLHAAVIGVIVDSSRVTGLVVETRQGTRRVEAWSIVDSSGDADVCWRAGAAHTRPASERLTQPATTTFRVGGVGADGIDPASQAELRGLMAQAVAEGRSALPRVEGSTHRTVLPGVYHTNLTRVSGFDPTDPWQLSAAEIEGRRQARLYAAFLRDTVPGYSASYVLSTSTWIGIRESRRLIGRHVLDRDDVLSARDFADAVARCGAPIEDHAAGSSTRWEYVGGSGEPTGRTYGIPFRALLPRELDGLVVAGRCLSASHDAHASVRSMGTCMAMGEAAGTAAAIAAAETVAVAHIDVEKLRNQLRENGAVL